MAKAPELNDQGKFIAAMASIIAGSVQHNQDYMTDPDTSIESISVYAVKQSKSILEIIAQHPEYREGAQ